MYNKLKSHLIIWTVLTFIVTVGALIDDSSKSTVVQIKLKENTTITVSVFRPFSDSLRISLKFDNKGKKDRSIFGRWSKKKDWDERGLLNFIEPGEPILLQVTDNIRTTIYEALPAGGVDSSETLWRDLVPYVNDGNPNIFEWPPRNDLRSKLSSGKTNLKISVLQVGSNTNGEIASLLILSPVSFDTVAPNYELIWFFMFWPIYAVALFIYGLILIIVKINHSRKL